MGSSTLADTLLAMDDPAEELANAISSAVSDASDNADDNMLAKTRAKNNKPKKENKESKTDKKDRKEKDRIEKTTAKRLEKQRVHDERQLAKRKQRATDLAPAVLAGVGTAAEVCVPAAANTTIPVLTAADTTPTRVLAKRKLATDLASDNEDPVRKMLKLDVYVDESPIQLATSAAVQEAPPATMAAAMAVDAGEAVAMPPVDAAPVDAAVVPAPMAATVAVPVDAGEAALPSPASPVLPETQAGDPELAAPAVPAGVGTAAEVCVPAAANTTLAAVDTMLAVVPASTAADLSVPAAAPVPAAANTTIPVLSAATLAAVDTMPAVVPASTAADLSVPAAAPVPAAANTTIPVLAAATLAAVDTTPAVVPAGTAADLSVPAATPVAAAANTTIPVLAAADTTPAGVLASTAAELSVPAAAPVPAAANTTIPVLAADDTTPPVLAAPTEAATMPEGVHCTAAAVPASRFMEAIRVPPVAPSEVPGMAEAVPGTVSHAGTAGASPVHSDDPQHVSPMAAAVSNIGLYKVSEEDAAAVRNATSAADLDRVIKCRLLVASRCMKKPTACPDWLLRWGEAKKDGKGRETWSMLQEWVADPSCAYARFRESHTRNESRYVEATWELVSVAELNMRFQTDIYPARADHVKKLVAGAMGKPTWHPQYPKDPEWKQYRILKQTIDGNRNESGRSSEFSVETSLDSASAEMTAAAVERMRGELPPALVSAAAETDGTGRPLKPKKTVVPKTEEQLAAANRKKNLTAGQAKVRKTITTITKLVDELTAAALSAAAELSPMDQAMIHNLKNLLTELQQSDNDYLQCALDVGTTLPELANLWTRQLADCKSATVRIKALVPRVPAASVPTAAATGVEVAPVAADATPGV